MRQRDEYLRAARVLSILVGLVASCALWGAVITVDDNGPADFQSIQAAIDAASAGDVVSVAPGTYRENIRLKSGVSVVGAGAGLSTINGGRRTSVAVLLDCDASTTLQGFTITRGVEESGGGIQVEGGAPLITLNRITGNSAVSTGGSGGASGGGLELLYSDAVVSANQIDGNDADLGGGVDIIGGAPLLSRNEISGNAAFVGGGVYVYYSPGARVHANKISANTADSGGGMEIVDLGSPIISNNLIIGNVAASNLTYYGYGGGLEIYFSDPLLVNNTLADNEALFGGGVALLSFETALINNILFRNTGLMESGAVDLFGADTLLFNNLFFLNVGGDCGGSDASLCNETSNLFTDPLLVDPASGDFRLQTESPAIDSARIEDAPSDDLRGQRRPLDGNGDGLAAPDRGAYEHDRDDVLGLGFSTPDTLSWDSGIGAATYHIYSGALSTLAERGADTCRDSEDPDRSDLLFTDFAVPPAGDGFAYLVSAVVNGSERSAGFDSRGIERVLPLFCP